MNVMRYLGIAAILGLSACVSTTPEGQTEELSEEVRALAAPNQDLTQVRIESDGCYWYRYEGRVETTFLPLMTRDNRMICVRAPTT
ncbi:hypothetical protein [Roseicyclus mahoneyensis]|jgi:hypothetical protein|uniref:Uncharacterized protein n=1 Tax=Roseicyclus mahoneyensis TaxID=164332 RepID=A0A316GM10_9RHOB|nr:hypothetical protein [Roseicyclus mahoneyensis]PWK60462.1 hypothetical protein C7455_10498 [Roseicyclus mahoneyensis]